MTGVLIVNDMEQYLEPFNFVDLCLHIIYINMYKLDFALNNLQWLICHQTKPQDF